MLAAVLSRERGRDPQGADGLHPGQRLGEGGRGVHRDVGGYSPQTELGTVAVDGSRQPREPGLLAGPALAELAVAARVPGAGRDHVALGGGGHAGQQPGLHDGPYVSSGGCGQVQHGGEAGEGEELVLRAWVCAREVLSRRR
ncbi:hypothetical protein GCM10009566_42410 [Streptomyces murinus]